MNDLSLKMNGIEVASPVSSSWSLSDLSSEESGRSTRTGVMTKDVIAQKRTRSIQWANLTEAEAVQIAHFCKKKSVTIRLTYFDVTEGATVTRLFYTGDLKGEDRPYSYNLSCDFIEI